MWIQTAGIRLDGDLTIPPAAPGLVVLTQDNPRDRAIAALLRERGLGTLLIEPLTPDEQAVEARRFDIDLVADRLIGTLRWLRAQPGIMELPIGLFGSGVNAAAAMVAAAARPGDVQAVVARGARADLAGGALAQLQAPTLLIVGELDPKLRALNEEAEQVMRAHGDVCVIPGADRYFSDPQALEQVAVAAGEWFTRHLSAPVPSHAKVIDSALPVEQTGLLDAFMPPSPTKDKDREEL
ncbi:dienelactone hydrolase family protein [Actinoplanes sp. HUAS TT8]|uniref:dienelactone hydrolase family protein n=1 Tax=Actinoplanes sp. HUAS TT8 TaxID=3447453 RepID=UPI003F526374